MTNIGPLDKPFQGMLVKSPAKGGWTYVVTDWSPAFFGTGGRRRRPSGAVEDARHDRERRLATGRAIGPRADRARVCELRRTGAP